MMPGPKNPASQQEKQMGSSPSGDGIDGLHKFSTSLILAAVISLFFVISISVLAPTRFGFYRDDSIYVVTAKALATGQGYHIISLPQEPAQTKYPPFYPFLLSLLWRLQPQFPENIPMLTYISLLSTAVFLGLTYFLLTRMLRARRWQAFLVISLTALNWRTLLLATSTLSEPVYSAFSVAALYLAGTLAWKRTNPARYFCLGVALALSFLTRVTAIAVPLALISHHAFRRQLSRFTFSLGIFGAAFFGWLAWCHYVQLPASGTILDYYTSYSNDWSNILALGQAAGSGSGLASLFGMIAGNVFMFALSIPAVCLGFDFTSFAHFGSLLSPLILIIILVFLLFTVLGFLRHRSAGPTELHGYVLWYIGLHLCWPYTAYDRFLMPLLPFLLFFALIEISHLVPSLTEKIRFPQYLRERFVAIPVSLLLATFPATALYEYGSGLWLLKASESQHASEASEVVELSSWLKTNTSGADILICYRESLYYLYTGRKAFFPVNSMNGFQSQEGKQKLLQLIKASKGKYLISNSNDFNLDFEPASGRRHFLEFIDEFRGNFIPVFASSNGEGRIYRIETN
jgi:hypothetical protein